MLIEGILLALLSAFVFGLYMSPRKRSSLDDLQFPASMGIGVFLSIVTAATVAGDFPPEPFPGQALAFLGGIIWSLGTTAFAASVRIIGLSRAAPIKESSTVPGVLVGAVLFREIPPAQKPLQFSAALFGSILIVSAALLLQATLVPSDAREKRLKATGVGLALLTLLCHSLYIIPTGKSLALAPSVFAVLLPFSLGIFVMMLLPCLFAGGLSNWLKQPLPAHAHAWLSGSLWAAGQILLWNAIAKAGIAVPWGVSGLNTLVAVAYGIVAFKEIHVGGYRREVYFGVSASLVGTLLLAISRL